MITVTTLSFLATLGAQVGSAFYNSSKGKKHAEEMARKQRAYEEKVTLEGIENARAEFAELCAFQKEMEAQIHRDRLDLIKGSHKANLTLEAYSESLLHWPLLVPPYVIKNDSIFNLEAQEGYAIPLNCILTTSTDGNFNNAVFFKLEENLAEFCSKYWNVSANKSIRFLQETWRDTFADADSKRKNLYVHLKNVPTLVISPVIKNEKLIFRFYWWGLSSTTSDAHINDINEFDPKLSMTVCRKMKYSDELIEQIISESTPKLEAFISYFADLYYWNFYKWVPSLPKLLEEAKINLNLNDNMAMEISDAFLCSLDTSFSFDIHDNLLYLNEIKRIITTDYEALKDCLVHVLSKNLCVDSHKNSDMLLDLIINHNLYSYTEFVDSMLLENLIQKISSNYNNQKNQSNVIMDSKDYIVRKEELLGLIKEIQGISYLPKENLHDFQQIERKIQEDQFRIALIGEYQGGKSTTFDALCGGREISPRGNNIKTSSCKITATNICNQEDEYAHVVWKNDIELIKTMSPILDSIEPEEIGYDPSGKKPFSYYEYLDLSNSAHRLLIENAVKELDSHTLSDELKDIVLIAKFILAFYLKSKDIRSKNRFSIEEASKLMTFPQNMIKRYNDSKGDVRVFEDREALFAFVQTVHCHIHSNQLGELGSSFVDCPGLFASDYDTSIALETIDTSDAVLYLLSGDKQIGQGDIRAIRSIFNNGMMGNPKFTGDNIFFAINQRKPDNQTSFIDLDLSQINQIGFSLKKLPLFNALLFYYAQFGRAYLDGKLDKHTIDKFLNSSSKHYELVSSKWVRDVNRILITLELDEEYEVDELSYDSVDIVDGISKNKTILDQIKNYVVRNKAKLILIDNGAVKINDGLFAIEKILEYQESSARKDVAERARELREAKDELKRFCDKVEDLLKNAFPDKKRKDYIQKVYNRYFLESTVVNSIAFDVTKNLLEYTRKGSTKWQAITSKIGTKAYRAEQAAKLRASIKVYFEKAFNATLTPVIEKWLNTHYADKDEDFNDDILPLAKQLGENIKNEWHELIKNAPVLSALCTSSIDTKTGLKEKMDKSVTFGKHQIKDDTLKDTSDMAIADIINQIISPIISTIVGIIVFHILDAIFTGGIATIYSILAGALTQLGLRSPKEINSPEDLGKKGKQLYEQIRSNLYEVLLKSEVRNPLCYGSNGLSKVIDEDVKMYSDFYEKELKNKTQEFETNVLKAEKEYEATKEQLDEIAKKAHAIRINEVIPLKEKVTEFTKRL